MPGSSAKNSDGVARPHRLEHVGVLDDLAQPEARRSTANHTTITGPNTLAMPAVPRDCTANRATRMTTETGITQSSNALVATSKPSTALSTEIAGVISPSP